MAACAERAGRVARKICGNSFAGNLLNMKGSPRNGTFRGEAGGDYPGHSDHYCVDEAAFATGVAFYAQAAYDFLMEE